MGTDIQKRGQGGALAAAENLRKSLTAVRDNIPETGGDQYLRFLTDGSWVFGQKDHEIDEDVELAVNPESFKQGWTCWTDRGDDQKNENLDEIMHPMGAPIPARTELPSFNEPHEWKQQQSVQMKVMTGKHKGTQLLFKSSSVGGRGFFKELIDQLIEQLEDDPENPVPVIRLLSDHYQHRKYGRTWFPVFEIVRFVSSDGGEAPDEQEKLTGEEPVEDEQEEPAAGESTRRRRRRG